MGGLGVAGTGGGSTRGRRGEAEREVESTKLRRMQNFLDVLSVVLELILYLDLGTVGRLAVGCKALQHVVHESKFGGAQVLMECRRLLGLHRARVVRHVASEVCANVVQAAAVARMPVCDLVALGSRVGKKSEVGCVKKLIMEVGNKLTELMGWCMRHCRADGVAPMGIAHRRMQQVRGIAVDGQVGLGARGLKLVFGPRTEWETGVEPVDEDLYLVE